MSLFLFFLLLLTNISDISCRSEPLGPPDEVRHAFLRLINDKCPPENSTRMYEKFRKFMNELRKYAVYPGADSLFEISLNTSKENIHGCVDEFVEELEKCSPEESKDWPPAAFDVLDALLDFSYEHKEKSFSVATYFKTCFKSDNREGIPWKLTACTQTFNPNTLEVGSLCQDILSLLRCCKELTSRECPPSEDVEKVMRGFLGVMSEACARHKIEKSPDLA